MNEQNNGKKQVAALWILVILVVILIAIIAGLFIKQAQAKNQEVATKDEKIAQLEQELAKAKEQNEEKTSNIANKENIVTTAFHKVYTSINGNDSDEGCTIDIPQINLKFENIDKLNKEIYNELYIKESTQGLEDRPSNTKYEFYINDNILSLVIIRDTFSDNKNYIVYNIDITTGNCISNGEVIRGKGKTSSEYETKLREICENTFKSRFGDLYSQNEMLLFRTLSYWDINTPMFLGKNNTINIIAKYYTEIGSGYVIDVLDTQI